MSQAMTRKDAAVGPALSMSPENYEDILARPLLLLPPKLRLGMMILNYLTRHLKGLETPLTLSTQITLAMQRENLKEDDAIHILNVMASSQNQVKYSRSDVVATMLAQKICEAIATRTRREEALRRREMANQPVDPDAQETIRNLASSFGSMGDI